MKNELRRFLLVATILFVLFVSGSEILFLRFFEAYDFPGRILIITFIWATTCVFYYWLMKTIDKNPKAFVRVFMMQAGLKMFLYFACLIIYLLFYKLYAVPFLFTFLTVYLIFAVFEVLSILKFVKRETGTSEQNKPTHH